MNRFNDEFIVNDDESLRLAVEVSALYEANFKKVWDSLHGINVNEHTEKKGNLTYLSWAWAYSTMMHFYPTFSYEFLEQDNHPDGTVTVNVECSITIGGIDLVRTMWLPVMDYRNKAVSNPDSMAINTAKMRCLTKCISMYGLGAYIYAGEDLPEESTTGDAQKKDAAVYTEAGIKIKKEKKAVPKAKVTQIKKGDVKKTKPEQKPVEEFYCEDDEAAEEYANFMIKTATDMHSDSMEHLIEFWKININATNYLKENFPDAYTSVKDAFSELKSNIIGDE